MSRVQDLEQSPDGVFLDIQSALAGRYSLMRELGRGGMAMVYLAHEVRLDRLVALKVLPPYLATPSLRERFLQEARTAAKLSHPNIVSIYAVDEVKDFVFFAMAYIEGETLAKRIGRQGPLPATQVASIVRDVAQALAYAHRQGVVHRDVKPDNILIDRDNDRPMVADFGIAHIASAASSTGVGQLIGTPEFMSPEQATGSALDGRSDIYSLGLVGFCALSGRLPFRGDSLGTILAQRISAPAPKLHSLAPTTPPRLSSVIDRCLATNPEERYQTGEALAEALDAANEKRRRLPEALDAWIHSVDELRFVQVMIAPIVASFVYPDLRTLVNWLIEQGPIGWEAGFQSWPGYLFFPAAPLAVYAAYRLACVRRVVAHGFNLNDLRMALSSEVARLRDSSAVTTNGRGVVARLQSASPGIALLVISATALDTCSPQWHESEHIAFYILWTLVLSVIVTARLSRSHARTPEQFDAETRAWLWHRWLGAVVAWLAGLGLRRRQDAAATHRPTEIALGGAAVALFDALPREVRRDLSSVPDVIERLGERAQIMRRQINELQALETSWPSGGADNVLVREQRDAQLLSLRRQCERAQQGLTDVVTSLEKIRMALLRLHSGVAGSMEITDDIAAADAVCRSLETVIASHLEVERILAPG
jgi:eukaryotic-like serine/threonine-protein kinase